MKQLLAFILLFIFNYSTIEAQYFGRNKPSYKNFDFKVEETENYLIHHYLKNPLVVSQLAATSEQWYANHKKIFGQDIDFKNPIIFYNNHAEFQQTNTISGNIGIGTGGVTEALKNRVVMPLGFSNQATHHVLAHELVHAFQFNNIQNSDSTSLQSLANLPLWMVEGMAEYFSLGRVDPFTAMWMRDAILNDRLPQIDRMTDPRYFPYRYGHSLIAFLGGVFGDNALNPLFMSTGRYGVQLGFIDILGTDTKTITNAWHESMKSHYGQFMPSRAEKPQGKKLISSENSGRMNLSPALSPNGKYVIFLSEKDLFSTDLFLADVQKGKILNKVTSLEQSGDLDYVNALESSGAWSPNSQDFVFVGVKKGKNVLVFKDADKGKTLHIDEIPGVPAFVNPTFSPDGKDIVVTGLVDGQVDLFSYNIKTKRVTQLTNDVYSENMANFSPDGFSLIFSYDKRSVDEGRKNGRYSYDIAKMDLANNRIEIYDFFHGADNLNPTFDHEGNFYFVSDRDGFRNLYKYDIVGQNVYQMTDLLTGISGIGGHSPMISASTKRNKVIYTHYYNNEFVIYEATSDKFLNQLVENTKTINLAAGTLPITEGLRLDIVGDNFKNIDAKQSYENIPTKRVPYSPNFKLDFITGGAGIGIAGGVNNNSFRNGQAMQGGIGMLFSDILGNNQIFSQVSMNGELLDAGGMVSYINRKKQLAWGVGLSHIPLRTGYQQYSTSFENINGVETPITISTTNLIRIYDQGVNLFAQFPFSTTLRLEGGIAGSFRSFRWDEYNDYYIGNQFTGYRFIDSDRRRIPTGETIQLDQFYTVVKGTGANLNFGLVGDNSYFGLTSPLAGHRFRIGMEHYIGNDEYTALIVDARKYFWMKPFSFAVRSTNYIRQEKVTNSVYPFYIGSMGFVRGLGGIVQNDIEQLGLVFSQLLGSKMMLGSFEVRLPFTGPRQLALIPINGFFSDLNLFFDSGVVFDDFDQFKNGKEIYSVKRDESGQIVQDGNGNVVYEFQNRKPSIISSAGISLRVNLFGALIVEPYYARVLAKGSRFNFGLNIIPGW